LNTLNVAIPRRIENVPLAVETRALRKRFGRTQALDGLDLTVPEGAFYVLVGPNGAGKSTALRVLLDIVRADAGSVEVLGIPSTNALARAQIGWVPESHHEQYGWMRVDRLLAHHAAYYPTWDRDYAGHLSRNLDIDTGRRFGRLSKGEQRRVQLLLALAHRPHVLLLDEPTDGLDPFARETVLGLLAEHLAESPATVIASTHLVHELEGLADHIGVIRGGLVTTQMTSEMVRLHLRHYTLELPDDWRGDAGLGSALMRTNGNAREARWTVWGEESRVRDRLVAAGARVRDVVPVSLHYASLALLARRETA
jgi:ABC-2 type transport system ATP-binding protein